jgi:hypothetical protein
VTLSAKAHVFGHEPTPVRVVLTPRSTGWRAGRAARWIVGGLVMAPVVGVVPPHAPWAAGAGVGGLVLGLRKWGERFTLREVEGACPRCASALGLTGQPPLRSPHPIPCDACGNPVSLRIDPAELDRAADGESVDEVS